MAASLDIALFKASGSHANLGIYANNSKLSVFVKRDR